MKFRITLHVDDDARRGLRHRDNQSGLASREEIVEELQTLWEAHLDDLRCEIHNKPRKHRQR
jgi:hypothetical protein